MFGSLIQKFKDGFKKTAKLFGAIGGIFSKKLDAASIEELEEALYGADFGVETTQEILDEIRKAYAKDKDLHGRAAAEIGKRVLTRVLEGAESKFVPAPENTPEVVALVGVNGAGKTTTAAKLAHLFGQNGYSVILGACDTFRAAANEQIAAWAARLNLDLVPGRHGADSADVAFDTVQAARSRGKRIAILDTAGRLHTKSHLMEELKKISRVVAKLDASAPHHRWLVVDGTLGSNSIEQAKIFHEAFNLTGLIVTKLDGTSRGGALVGIWRELRIPIYYVGLGEKPEDLQPFSVENYVSAIFDAE
ncbi:MAG: signal recognition particle-docking protein FtsY [Opitutales bacterium]|nr:signal recognition particle-docking protein FtsY [Opitutales bacterium]